MFKRDGPNEVPEPFAEEAGNHYFFSNTFPFRFNRTETKHLYFILPGKIFHGITVTAKRSENTFRWFVYNAWIFSSTIHNCIKYSEGLIVRAII